MDACVFAQELCSRAPAMCRGTPRAGVPGRIPEPREKLWLGAHGASSRGQPDHRQAYHQGVLRRGGGGLYCRLPALRVSVCTCACVWVYAVLCGGCLCCMCVRVCARACALRFVEAAGAFMWMCECMRVCTRLVTGGHARLREGLSCRDEWNVFSYHFAWDPSSAPPIQPSRRPPPLEQTQC